MLNRAPVPAVTTLVLGSGSAALSAPAPSVSGPIKLTLGGAANGRTPTRLSWDFRCYDGNTILHQGPTTC